MKKQSFEQAQAKIISDNKLYKRVIFILVILVFLMGINNFRMISNEKIFITPCGNPENSMWIGASSISPEYMEIIGRDIISLALNVSPETVNQQDNELLYYVSPELRAYMVDNMKDDAQKIIKNGITQNFYIDQMKVVIATQTLYITGYLKTFIGNQQTSNLQQVYKMKFKTNSMNVKISEFRLLDPNLDKSEMKAVGI